MFYKIIVLQHQLTGSPSFPSVPGSPSWPIAPASPGSPLWPGEPGSPSSPWNSIKIIVSGWRGKKQSYAMLCCMCKGAGHLISTTPPSANIHVVRWESLKFYSGISYVNESQEWAITHTLKLTGRTSLSQDVSHQRTKNPIPSSEQWHDIHNF